MPGVDDAAVVVAERPDRGKYLVAFYAGAAAIEVEVLREWLGRSLPHYMVPVSFHRRNKLPLTANGKIDAKALTALATELEVVDEAGDPPRTPAEQRVAAAYAGVLGVAEDQIGRLDHFFDRGGIVAVGGEAGHRVDRRRSRSRTSRGTPCWPTWPR